MANSTHAHIRSIRENSSHKVSHLPHVLSDKRRGGSSAHLLKETVRYEKYSRLWSILSNVAAIVSVSSALYTTLNKKRFW